MFRLVSRRFFSFVLVACMAAAPVVLMGCPVGTGNASVVVVNDSSATIVEINVSPTTSTEWGANQISSAIAPGETRTISGIPAGSYDLRALTNTGGEATRLGVALVDNAAYTWTLVDGKWGGDVDMLRPSGDAPSGAK